MLSSSQRYLIVAQQQPKRLKRLYHSSIYWSAFLLRLSEIESILNLVFYAAAPCIGCDCLKPGHYWSTSATWVWPVSSRVYMAIDRWIKRWCLDQHDAIDCQISCRYVYSGLPWQEPITASSCVLFCLYITSLLDHFYWRCL